ncbi:hypothetical protein H0O00_02170 [Candidatus Micrarchaeota archaeon]|nr:hypothetical protein [Candidatus Micrarchaeota archaeon]
MNTLQIFVLALVLVGAVFAVAPPQVYSDYGYSDYGSSSGGCCCGSGAILAVLGGVAFLKKKN